MCKCDGVCMCVCVHCTHSKRLNRSFSFVSITFIDFARYYKHRLSLNDIYDLLVIVKTAGVVSIKSWNIRPDITGFQFLLINTSLLTTYRVRCEICFSICLC